MLTPHLQGILTRYRALVSTKNDRFYNNIDSFVHEDSENILKSMARELSLEIYQARATMKSISIADRFCPQNHEAAITAVAYDPPSDTRVTADANGLIVVCRNGEATPGLILQAKGAIRGALALMKGGSRLAVGDDSGTIYVYDLRNGELLFTEERSGERGLRRAFRGISINKTGTLLAAVSIDNLLRIWDLRSEKRLY